MNGRMMHDTSGNTIFQPYGKEGQAIYSVSRGGLNLSLIDIADKHSNINFHFAKGVSGYSKRNNAVKFQDGSQKQSPLVFGTDGAFSAIRTSIQRSDKFNYSQNYLPHGYKELHIPPTESGAFRMDPNALHIWPRGHFMLIALPNSDKSFTCTLFLPFEGKQDSFEAIKGDEEALLFFKKQFPDALELMPEFQDDFRKNPVSSLVTIRCSPWTFEDRVLLMGDASHAIVPFYGQGMNSGFEDCTVLDELAEKHNEDWPAIFNVFNKERVADANAIADLALKNFVEMRDHVGDPMFLLRKKMEGWLHQRYPNHFVPVYSQVTFSNIPYHKAQNDSIMQDGFFNSLLIQPNIEENWEQILEKEFIAWKNL